MSIWREQEEGTDAVQIGMLLLQQVEDSISLRVGEQHLDLSMSLGCYGCHVS